MPAAQMPAVDTTSQGGMPSSPCTMTAWPGISWSAQDVPQASTSTFARSSPRRAAAASWALEWVKAPVVGSMA